MKGQLRLWVRTTCPAGSLALHRYYAFGRFAAAHVRTLRGLGFSFKVMGSNRRGHCQNRSATEEREVPGVFPTSQAGLRVGSRGCNSSTMASTLKESAALGEPVVIARAAPQCLQVEVGDRRAVQAVQRGCIGSFLSRSNQFGDVPQARTNAASYR